MHESQSRILDGRTLLQRRIQTNTPSGTPFLASCTKGLSRGLSRNTATYEVGELTHV